MTARELARMSARRFQYAGVPDAALDAQLLICHVLKLSRAQLVLDGDRELTADEQAACEALLARREKREPLQYILGEQWFFGRRFFVGSGVLIPRFDTEILVQQALTLLEGKKSPRVLDVCTGSGIIGLTVKAERPDAVVTLSDLSETALSLARRNAVLLGLDVAFVQGDMLRPFVDASFDAILCNPPYIPTAVCDTLQEEVLREPRLALDGGADGLDFYRTLADAAPRCLKPDGVLVMEIGYDQGNSVPALFSGWNDVSVSLDMNQQCRVVSARKRS